eukprot:TRINITY_DN3493_c0_g1_i1.p1 TRINITY_DN3493_c0_g1~~TRINITY_DN3493_c0_g1_i1.p1  ORF type:complete len:188 (-),score=43.48 TRINITY_DN3493_c0_g1_i1:26-589(-)
MSIVQRFRQSLGKQQQRNIGTLSSFMNSSSSSSSSSGLLMVSRIESSSMRMGPLVASFSSSSSNSSMFTRVVSAEEEQEEDKFADFDRQFLSQEYLEKKENEGVHVGRAWRADELRLKSFEDLQRLWIVLLKEKNLLLSEKRDMRKKGLRMENPMRLKKVKQSMARIKTVVHERNTVYKQWKASQED